jgi:hypothetical protein
MGAQPLHEAAGLGHETVKMQLLAARDNVDLRLIKALQKRTLNCRLAPQTKKQQEDADRAMKELLEEEDKDAAAAAAISRTNAAAQAKRRAKRKTTRAG